ncbi:Helix-turn-helix type 3 domain protein [Candidatus Magnetomorum sp. HK-1]|nr:Helix-turn-helix type 3 domain protein [Candidatus Magnetomorum sp. HK-1]
MTLQERIKFIQKKLGISQRKLAKSLEVPPTSVSDWYNNNVTPRSDKLILLVDKFDVNPLFLLKGIGEPFLNEAERKKKWTKKEEKRFSEKYSNIIFLINNCGKNDLVKGFYGMLNISNWMELLDQKLGKKLFGNLQTIAKTLNYSVNILLVEVYAEIFTEIVSSLSQKKPLKPYHLYILSEVCDFDKDDFQLIVPNDYLSNIDINNLESFLDNKTKMKFRLYGLKGFAENSKTTNTAWQGIRMAFKQLDDMIRYQEIPNLCQKNGHNHFYWTKCPLCEEKINKARIVPT